MIQENELITLLVGIGVAIFILTNFRRLFRIPSFPVLFAAFTFTLMGWVLTNLEGFLLGDLLNLIEHACYTASSILIAVWCRRFFLEGKPRA